MACSAWFGQELERIVAVAERCDAWLLVDEVYRGAEHTGEVHLSDSRCSLHVSVCASFVK